ncbi:MAG TPA: hypothetical protein VJ160_08580 [Anaerolineales bacterium]|jgi:hypothetical protein|nr:hypothetical protein [Anaerolineales bacterium]
MFDNLRDLSEVQPPAKEAVSLPAEDYEIPGGGRILGMTPGQRLVISILLFFAVLLIGTMCLLVTQRVILIL